MDQFGMTRLGQVRQQEILEQAGYLRRQPHTEFFTIKRWLIPVFNRVRTAIRGKQSAFSEQLSANNKRYTDEVASV